MNDTVERAVATGVQALFAVGTYGATPFVIPGAPTWLGVALGVVVAVGTAVAKSLGVKAASTTTQIVPSGAKVELADVQKAFEDLNIAK